MLEQTFYKQNLLNIFFSLLVVSAIHNCINTQPTVLINRWQHQFLQFVVFLLSEPTGFTLIFIEQFLSHSKTWMHDNVFTINIYLFQNRNEWVHSTDFPRIKKIFNFEMLLRNTTFAPMLEMQGQILTKARLKEKTCVKC